MSRPKGSKNKSKEKTYRPHQIKLTLPKYPMQYQAKRLYWVVLAMERRMALDVTAVKASEYTQALQAYMDIVEKLKKEGIEYGHFKKRVEKQGLVSDQSESITPGNSDNRSPSVGAGIPPLNPLA